MIPDPISESLFEEVRYAGLDLGFWALTMATYDLEEDGV